MKRTGLLANGRRLVGMVAAMAVLATTISGTVAQSVSAESDRSQAWSFGVMDDTQWTAATDPANANPNAVAVSIINQINPQLIKAGVKFVIQVGDLTENGNDADIAARAAAARPLLNAGIGFFPMRGNHETYGSPANSFGIPAFQADFPQTRGLGNTFGARSFSSPTSVSADLKGMSYSFDYGTPGNNARFVILDDWATPSKNAVNANGYNYGYSIGDQQAWISGRLDKNTRSTTQAFVFSHQPLIAENHQDSPFAGNTDANPAMQNAFFASLQSNDVKYYISGHDHMNQRSIIASPDGNSAVQEIIGASDSSKFYTPKALSDPKWYGQKTRETSVSQDLNTVGYYIYTVDGPRVTVDYYADDHGNWLSDASYPSGPTGAGTQITPTLNFVKKATWGYSLNGKEFLVGGGATNGTSNSPSYTAVQDSFDGTSARILAGTYKNTATDYTGRVLVQAVDTGWTADTRRDDLSSNILTLWGMAPLGTTTTDTYVLSMTFDAAKGGHDGFAGLGVLATRDAKGRWVNAVDRNAGGGVRRFVVGPWQPQDTLGTYGVDPDTDTAWAVINYNASFAVDRGLDLVWRH
jgi:Calcineurin-like phosphoesterase